MFPSSESAVTECTVCDPDKVNSFLRVSLQSALKYHRFSHRSTNGRRQRHIEGIWKFSLSPITPPIKVKNVNDDVCENLMSFSSHSVEMLLHFSLLLALVACAKAKNNCSERGNTSSSAIVKTAFPVTAFPSLTMFLDHEATSSVFMLLEEIESYFRTFPCLCF